jgi:hypothetical protein
MCVISALSDFPSSPLETIHTLICHYIAQSPACSMGKHTVSFVIIVVVLFVLFLCAED